MHWKQIEKQIQKMDGRKVSVGAAIVALTLIGISVWHLNRQGYLGPTSVSSPVTPVVSQPLSGTYRHPLTGEPIAEPVDPPAVYAVMVENSADAWPQSGVDQAFEVIEAPAEGGIPRFLALFAADNSVESIGPVRSARPYFIDWASAYHALFAHVGGSPDALAKLASTEAVFDLNEFYHQYQFWRSPDRLAPHNVYTSTESLGQGLAKFFPTAAFAYSTYAYKDDLGLGLRPVIGDEVHIAMGASLYEVSWKYDQASNRYRRSRGDVVHTMSDGAPLVASNVVVLATSMTVLDEIGRLSIQTIGQGDGWLLQDGGKKNITWKKSTDDDLLRFYDRDGQEVALNAGPLWVEVVGSLEAVTFE